jgi:hypothetical protein
MSVWAPGPARFLGRLPLGGLLLLLTATAILPLLVLASMHVPKPVDPVELVTIVASVSGRPLS